MGKPKKNRFGRVFVITLVAGIVGVFCLNYYQQEVRMRALLEEKETLTEQRDELAVEKSRLDRLYYYTKTDAYIEQYVRDRLGWVKEGEIIFHLPEEEDIPE